MHSFKWGGTNTETAFFKSNYSSVKSLHLHNEYESSVAPLMKQTIVSSTIKSGSLPYFSETSKQSSELVKMTFEQFKKLKNQDV